MSTFHTSPAWKAARLAAKRRDGWRCVRCRSRVGLEVDHIEPRERRPDLALTLDNLQTLCRECHIDKTRADKGVTVSPQRQAWADAVNRLCVKTRR